ncbi:hypothetical protein QBC43DRAFT_250283 [Cladorrhinum sp. PSN259]|nr:hypothetical protein QBC43DRAFT_250283 [Cladorrhinum sp. PSN259]
MLTRATAWLNRPASPPQGSGKTAVGDIFIRHNDSSCTLAAKDIIGLEAAGSPGAAPGFFALDRFHRFLRLWRALTANSPSGWDIASIDRVIGARLLGGGHLNTTCIEIISAVDRLAPALSSQKPTTVHDVINLYAGLLPSTPAGASPTLVTYTSVYLNQTANGPVHPAFELPAIARNDSATPPVPVPKLSDAAFVDYISICLNISAPDTKLIIQSLLSQQPSDDVLSVASLSRVYAVASISSRLGLTVPDYFLLAKLSGLAPLEHVAQLADLQEVTAKLGALGLSIPDLELLLVPPPTPRLAGDIAVERITAILTGIQSQYADIQKANTSPVNPDVPAGENASAVLDLVSKVPGTIQTDISRFKQMLGGSLDAAEGAPFLQKIFGSFLSGDAVTAIAEAQAALAAAPGDESRKAALTNVVAGQLSAAFAAQQRAKALGGALASGLALPTDVLAALQEDIPALATLLDAALASGSVSDISFPKQYRAIRLLYRVWVALGHFNLPVASVSWLLQNAQKLGWASLASLPTDVGDSPVSWAAWQALVDYVQLVHSGAFTPVRNPADKNSRFTLESFLSLSLAVPAPGADQLAGYFASLTSYRVDIIRALITHLHLTPDSLKAVETMTRLQSAASVIRQLGMSTAAAISLAEAEAPSRDDMVAARRALKLRYAVDSDWYGVLKGVQDPLRLSKRDALVAFLLAVNKPRITSARDLSELLLLDVQMGTVTLTSRIIQAHQSLQQFVQRLLMGLEPTPVVEGDASWAHWAEMSQYRLWEANKKVFLYPENWIEPALRDNKSELYRNLEADLKKQPLTDASTESAIAGYLGGLDHIADLEVMSCFYDTATTTLHVFARTKGGSPREYYHRTMVLEAEWTPWEHLQDVNPAGNHLVTFFRRNRLTVSWPVFSYEQDPAQASQPPAYPDPDNMAGEKPDPVRKRLLVQLAVCERNPDTGKWSQPVVTEKGVYWPGPLSSDKYADATAFPPNLEAAISLHFWDLGLKLGELIVVRVTGRGREINSTALFGVFTLTGCKGYPEPFLDDSSGFAWRFTALPAFKETDFLTQRFIKTHLLSNSAPLDLAIMAMPSPQLASILGREYGRFVVTYPTQPTIVDRALIGLQMFSVASTPKTGTHLEMVSSKIRAWFVPEGTFLPYFVSDSSTRGYAVIPGYESAVKGDVNFRTASATLNFFNDAVRLALKYIDIYFNELNKDARALRTRLNRDEKYLELKREFLAVYANAPTPWDVTLRTPRANLVNFYHPLVCFLRGQLYAGGTGLLMARSTQLRINKDFDFNVAYQPTPHVRAPLPREELDFANRAAYSIYNWELFFHLPFQIAAGLSADKQYEQARKWYHYIFNPQGADMEDPDTGADKAKAPQKKYWQTKPFFKTQVADYQAALIDKILGAVAGDPTGASLANELKNQILLWRRNPYSPHVIARSRPVAYQLSVVIKYIQNLVDWGDGLFRQLTREALTQALTLYGVADRLLGAKPRVVEPAVRVPARTYNELGRSVDLLGNALLSLENLVPDLGKLPHGGRELPQPPNPPLTSLYFGIPPNSSMLQLWDTVADRLYKIRHSQDIDGNFVSLSLTAPPIDPGALIKALASGQSLSDVIGQLGAPLPHYRFAYLHERAQVMTSHVVELGSQLLSMLQRRDDEGLARLRANSEPKVLAAVRETKAAAVTQNKSAVKALEASRALAEERNTYYQQQLKNAINKVELDGLLANIDAMAVDGAMASGYGAASSWSLVPVLSVGVSGFGGSPQVSASWGGSNMASKLGNDMSAAATTRSSLGTEAQLAATVAAYVRRIEDWTFQQKLAEHEMAQVDQQIVAAKDQGIVLDKELAAHDVQTTEATATATYLAGKFTNTELFDWAAGRVAATYTRAYNLAFSMAKKAERCMAFELGDFSGAASGIIQYGQYDNLRSGLLAGGDLLADLDRLAATYADRHARELELTKHVSLAQLDPDALLRLRSTGSCIFALPEWLFDLDYPGHYFRRTRSLSLSIPCVVGPYTTVAATLRLLSSRFRARPTRTRPASAYPESPPGGDDRFVYDVAPPAVATATSSAVNDAGVFDLRLDGSSDPRYLPFENAGTLGTYALDLSPTHQFPYSAVADVVLTVNYTARDGGSTVRDAAKPAPTSGTAAIPFRTAFPTEWATLRGAGREVQPVLVAPPPSSTGSSTGGTGGWTLPHWATAQGRTPVVQQTVWCAVPDPATASLDGLILVVAGQELTLAKDTAGGNYWKATLAAKKVVLGQAVSVAWGDPADRNKVAEIICVVGWNYSTA